VFGEGSGDQIIVVEAPSPGYLIEGKSENTSEFSP